MRFVTPLVVLCAIAILLAPSVASAMDTSIGLAELKRTTFTIHDGAPTSIKALAASKDGYLWIGDDQGLVRFDGSTFERIAPLPGRLRSVEVSALLAARNGDVWVGYYWGGVAVVRDGVVLAEGYADPKGVVLSITEDTSGDVWVLTMGSRSQVMRRGAAGWTTIDDATVAPLWTQRLVATADGSMWLTTNSHSLYRVAPGATRFVSHAVREAVVDNAVGGPDRRLWLLDDRGVQAIGPPPTTGASIAGWHEKWIEQREVMPMLFDRDGALWIAKWDKVTRIAHPLADATSLGIESIDVSGRFAETNGSVLAEDDAGGIWIASAVGLGHLEIPSVTSDPVMGRTRGGHAMQTTASGAILVDGLDGLHRIEPGKPAETLAAGTVFTGVCAGTKDALYVASAKGIARIDGSHASTPVAIPDQNGRPIYGCLMDRAGRVLLGVSGVGVLRSDGTMAHWVLQEVIPGLPHAWPEQMTLDAQGRPILGMPFRGIVRLDGDRWVMIAATPRDSLGMLHTIQVIGDEILVGGEFGLGRVADGRLQVLTSADYPFLSQLGGLAATPSGELWMFGARGIARLPLRDVLSAFNRPGAPLEPRLYDDRDGLVGVSEPQSGTGSSMVVAADGRILVATNRGLSWIDPGRPRTTAAPPPTMVREARVDGRPLDLDHDRSLHLPAGARRLEFTFAAISLADPERVRIRYRLENFDRDWIDAGRQRVVAYTNLSPGDYRFALRAANADGVWNATGDSVAVHMPPTFVQSRLFIALCVLLACVALWIAYLMRVRVIAGRIRRQLETRVGERERIARELHDTVLQSQQAVILGFQRTASRLRRDDPLRSQIERALDAAEAVLVESRDRIRGLREEADTPTDFIDALRTLAQTIEPGASAPRPTIGRTGASRRLDPIVADELLAIAREAMSNAIRHAAASRIDVLVSFEPAALRVTVSDDGVGIDPAVVRAPKPGHWGIVGIHERAARIRARVVVDAHAGRGTTIAIEIAGRRAYVRASRVRRFVRGEA